jgi:hypothetical protein
MKYRAKFFVILALISILFGAMPSGQAATIGDMAAMQASMQRYIDGRLVKGAFLYVDMKAGKVRPLYPIEAHTMILSMGEYFVLCSDFKDEEDNSVNVDFYLAKENDLYVVFHVSVDDREQLGKWMRAGEAKRLN